MTEGDPSRQLAFECALSGSVNVVGNAFHQSSGRQTPQSTSGPSGSGTASPTSQVPATTNNNQMPPWSNGQVAGIASMLAQCSGESVFECTKNGLLGSLSPLNEQAFTPVNTDTAMPATQDLTSDKPGNALLDATDLQFPSWDQLPEDFQNPTTSADFTSTIPISTTGFSMPSVESSAGGFLAWDNDEMNFAMDMDLDLDMDMNLLGKC
jgi:hypothetical protein